MKTIPVGKTDHAVFWIGWMFFGLERSAGNMH
jgi:hypothetical protein